MAVVVAALLPVGGASASAGGPAVQAGDERPNIVVIMTDDQTHNLLEAMPRTQELLVSEGTRFSEFVVVNPLCCPSHAAFLTGQYSKHTRVYNNTPPLGGMFAMDQGNTLPVWLQQAGYATGRVGKATLGYASPLGIPPGWDSWESIGGDYYGYTLVDGTRIVPYGSAAEDYSTDVLAVRSENAIRRFADGDRPFFLMVNPFAPHHASRSTTATPAPRHAGAFDGVSLPADPAIDEPDMSDKAPEVAAAPRLSPPALAAVRAGYQSQLESLLAVDEMVERLVSTLEATGELANTVIIYTSDNGLLHGQHRLRGKNVPYEPAIRVPLVVRGPGFPAGAVVSAPVANIDLAPTIVGLAGATPGLRPDGIDLRTTLAGAPDDRSILIEGAAAGIGQCFDALRTSRWKYVRFASGDEELYDLATDPYELTSVARDVAYAGKLTELRAELESLRWHGKPCLPSAELRVGDLVVHEPPSGVRNAEVPVTLTNPLGVDATVTYTIRAGGASAATGGLDFSEPTTRSVTIPKGATTGYVSVPILADALAEGSGETFEVVVTGVSAGSAKVGVARAVGVTSILDLPCCEPSIAVGEAHLAEGHIGSGEMRVPVTANRALSAEATVRYQVIHGTTSRADVVATTGSIVIPQGASSAVITVATNGDQWPEPTESFSIRLLSVTGADLPSVGLGAGTGKLLDDDPDVVQTGRFQCISETGSLCATPPAVPTKVVGAAGDGRVTVSWTAPRDDGGRPITGYQVTASPGGQTCSWTSGPLSCTVTGLSNGTPYTFRVVASNVIGTGSASAPSAEVVPQGSPARFVPVDPRRVLDSRPTSRVGPYSTPWSAGTTRQVTVAGVAGVPADAEAVALNVTVTETTDSSFLSVWPSGRERPTVSSMNWQPGWTIANALTVKVGMQGKVDVFNNRGSVQVVVDVVGYYKSGPFAGLTPVAPSRLLDSRAASQVGPYSSPWLGTMTREVAVAGVNGVPPEASAVVLNVTVTATTGSSFLSVWPKGQARPRVSSLNWQPGWTIANAVTVKVGAGGMVNVFNRSGSAHVIIDVVGYFAQGSGHPFHPIDPVRIQDSRPESQVGPYSTPWAARETREISVIGGAGSLPAEAAVVLMNVTATATTSSSFLSVWPSGTPRPPISSSNWQAGWTIPNAVTAQVGAGGKVNFYNNRGSAHLVADVSGWYGSWPVIQPRLTASVAESAGSVELAVTLSSPSAQVVRVSWHTTDGTASSADYVSQAPTVLTFLPGETSKSIAVPIAPDALDEDDETFEVVFSDPTSAFVAGWGTEVTIVDDDAMPTISVGDASPVVETGGMHAFTLSLSGPSGRPVSVRVATHDGSASAGSDYLPLRTTVTFSPGSTSQPVVVLIGDDAVDEDDETYTLDLLSATNAWITDGSGVGVIVDDDTWVTATIRPSSSIGGESGLAGFTVDLSEPSTQTVQITWSTVEGSATAADFTPQAPAVLTFLPGETSKEIAVPITADTLDEHDETFSVVLTDAINARLAGSVSAHTIVDDDDPPMVTVRDAPVVTEGGGSTLDQTFTITLSEPSGKTVQVEVGTADGTAVGGLDYLPRAGVVTFLPGQTSKRFVVTVLDDSVDEPQQSYTLDVLSGSDVAIADGSGVGRVNDDDDEPTVTISDASILEGDSGWTQMTFTITLSGLSEKSTLVDLSTSAVTATAGSDYVERLGHRIRIPTMTTGVTQTVSIRGDRLLEPDEILHVELSNPLNLVIADGLGVGTIINDD